MKSDYKANDLLKKLKYMVERLKQPSTWWKIGVAVVTITGMYYNLNYRISSLEEFRETVDVVEIKTTLAQIQSDISRIKSALSSNLK